MQYEERPEFKRDLKKLVKKFPSLCADLKMAQKGAVELMHVHNLDNQAIVALSGYAHETVEFYKLRKFACKALKGRGAKSGIRVIYAYHRHAKKVVYLEIYFKGNKENEDPERIKQYAHLLA